MRGALRVAVAVETPLAWALLSPAKLGARFAAGDRQTDDSLMPLSLLPLLQPMCTLRCLQSQILPQTTVCCVVKSVCAQPTCGQSRPLQTVCTPTPHSFEAPESSSCHSARVRATPPQAHHPQPQHTDNLAAAALTRCPQAAYPRPDIPPRPAPAAQRPARRAPAPLRPAPPRAPRWPPRS